MGKRRPPYRTDDPGPLRVGQVFRDKYEICGLIGRGGYAWVYEARHRFMGHRVAIKIVPPHHGIDPDVFRRAQAEAQIQRKLRGEAGIVHVDDADITEDGLLFVIMELLEGRLARGILQEHGRLEIEEVLRLAAPIARTLAAAHDVGVIHRDFKPENVFIVAGNKPKVLDFGVAKVDGAAWTTQRDLLLGTPMYMSPEQALGIPLTEASDVYAFGVFIYEAITGHHPVQYLLGNRQISLQTYARIITTEDPPPLTQFVPHSPHYVTGLVSQLIAKRLERRFLNMRQVLAAILESQGAYEKEARSRGIVLQTRDLSLPSAERPRVQFSGSPSSQPTAPATAAGATSDPSDLASGATPASAPVVFGNLSSRRIADAHHAADAHRTKPIGTPSASEHPEPINAPFAPTTSPAPTMLAAPAAPAEPAAPAAPAAPPVFATPTPRAAVLSTRAVVRPIATSTPPRTRARALTQVILGAAAFGFVVAGLGALLQSALVPSASQRLPTVNENTALVTAPAQSTPPAQSLPPAEAVAAVESPAVLDPPVAPDLPSERVANGPSAELPSPTPATSSVQRPRASRAAPPKAVAPPELAALRPAPTSVFETPLAPPAELEERSLNTRVRKALPPTAQKSRAPTKPTAARTAPSAQTEPRLIDRLAEILDQREEAKRQAAAQQTRDAVPTAPPKRSTPTPAKR